MRRTSKPMLALAVGAVVGCGPHTRGGSNSVGASATPNGAPHTTPDSVEQLRGTLFVTGSEPVTTVILRRESGPGITLVGDLADELRQLSGAEVAVYGAQATPATARGFSVQRYDLLSIDGQRPLVGILLAYDGAVWLAAADTIQLMAAPDTLRAQAGAKAWVVGRRTEHGLVVQSYGVLRPAPE